MRTSILAVALWALVANGPAVVDRTAGCRFAISPETGSPQVVGGNVAASRASIMAQPDSPLVILRADLTGVELTTSAGWYSRAGRHVLDVKNVSDKVITDAEVMVRVAFGPNSGGGSGTKLGSPLQPGAHARIEWTSGSGRGTDGTGREVFIVALVDEVQMAGCTYMPSQAWPAPTDTSEPER